jgi:hypothetical protein
MPRKSRKLPISIVRNIEVGSYERYGAASACRTAVSRRHRSARSPHDLGGLFILGSEGSQVAAVSMLNQIEGPAASNALAALAIFSPRAEVRRRASESLTRRDLRAILTRLIGPIRKFRAI